MQASTKYMPVFLFCLFALVDNARPADVETLTSQTLTTPAGKAFLEEQKATEFAFNQFGEKLVDLIVHHAPRASLKKFYRGPSAVHFEIQSQTKNVVYLVENESNTDPAIIPENKTGYYIRAFLAEQTIEPNWLNVHEREKKENRTYYEVLGSGKQRKKIIDVYWTEIDREIKRPGLENRIFFHAVLGSEVSRNLETKIKELLNELGRSLPAPRRIEDPVEDYKVWLFKKNEKLKEIEANDILIDWPKAEEFMLRKSKRSGPNSFYRIQEDLNNDGMIDMAITDVSNFYDTVGLSGMNGYWRIYLADKNGGFYYVGTPGLGIEFKVVPLAPGTARLTWEESYRRCDGKYVYEINPNGLYLIVADFYERPRADEP